ncbi:MAG: DUF4349 domain-containing protein [Kofleriaceae bacterium]
MKRACLLLISILGCSGSPRSAKYEAPAPRSVVLAGPTSMDAPAGAEMVTMTASAPPSSPVRRAIGLFSGGGAATTPVAQVLSAPGPKDAEKLVIEAWIDIKIDDVAKAASEIRARVEADGGRVVSENVIGPAKAASSAAMELRVPPAKAAIFQSWLATIGVVESRRVMASDVSKQLFDQELALKNFEVTMARLQKLAEKDIAMKELIELENEMTRVRGQIERIKGEQRFLLDRVEFATITLSLSREGGPIEFAPHARIHPGPHLAMMTLLDPAGRPRSRIGGGATIHIQRWLTFDLDGFPQKDGDSRIIVGTIGTGLYSSFLGNGTRRYLNPYLGFRAGIGHLTDENCAVIGAEVGVELYKHKYVQIEIAVRGLAFFREDKTDAALHTMLGFEVPF